MFNTKMNYVYSFFSLFLVFNLIGAPLSFVEDGLYSQTDVLLDQDLVYRYSEYFPECSEADGLGLVCSYRELEGKISTFYRFEGDGSNRRRPVSAHLWKEDSVDLAWEPSESEKAGLSKQVEILRKKQSGKILFDRRQLLFVAKCLLKKEKHCRKGDYSKHLRALRLAGADGRGNVQYTGYFTPRIEARNHKTDEFRYPIFRRPKEWRDDNGPHPTREEIDKKGALEGRGLEIAWTKRPLAIFMMQVQGSGIAHFEDGTEKLLSYDGKNGQAYVSIGRLLVEDGHISPKSVSLDAIEAFFEENPDKVEEYLYQNPSYVFFKPKGNSPFGAAGTSLTPGHSIAVDPNIIPLGAVLLGRVPILDSSNRVIKHEWRLLFAQDTGGAIIGATHIDLFTGIGDEAKKIASNMHHYGELWLLLPK